MGKSSKGFPFGFPAGLNMISLCLPLVSLCPCGFPLKPTPRATAFAPGRGRLGGLPAAEALSQVAAGVAGGRRARSPVR